jgi:hypothetical protein
MENAGERKSGPIWLRRSLKLPWAEMIGSVFCFHFALADPRVIIRAPLATAGVILLATAISNVIKQRGSTHS